MCYAPGRSVTEWWRRCAPTAASACIRMRTLSVSALLTRAVRGGRAISQVAKLPLRTLRELVEKDGNAPRFALAAAQAVASESPESVHDAAFAAIESFDSAKLESVLRGAVLAPRD